MEKASPVVIFPLWAGLRSFLHNGWWLLANLWLVLTSHLSITQLLIIAAAQALASLLAEVPAGMCADRFGPKRVLVAAHFLMGVAMLGTALTVSFPLLLLAQVVWGVSWAMSSGADVSWMSQVIPSEEARHKALVSQGRTQLYGAILGIAVLGVAGLFISHRALMICAGVVMLVLGAVLAMWSPAILSKAEETNVAWRQLGPVLQSLIRQPAIRVMLVLTVIVTAGEDLVSRVYVAALEARGMESGASDTAIVTVLNIGALVIGVLLLSGLARFSKSMKGSFFVVGVAGGLVAISALLGGIIPWGLAVAVIAFMVCLGTFPVLRTNLTIMLNRSAADRIRTTTHSFVAQTEHLSELVVGIALAVTTPVIAISLPFWWVSITFAAIPLAIIIYKRLNKR